MAKEVEKESKLAGAISWVIMHTFMKGEIKRVTGMIDRKELEKLKILHNKVEELSQELKTSLNKDKAKIEREERVEKSKIISNDWLIKNKVSSILIAEEADKKTLSNNWELLLKKTIEESNLLGLQLEEFAEKTIYFIKAAILITERKKCSVSLLVNELKINKNNAYYLINKLQDAGIILDEYGKRNPIVLMENLGMLETILYATDLKEILDNSKSD